MNEKTLEFDNISVNKKKFHKSKQPIDLDLKKVDQIAVSDKFRHNDDSFKYNILLVAEKVKLLKRYVLFCLN